MGRGDDQPCALDLTRRRRGASRDVLRSRPTSRQPESERMSSWPPMEDRGPHVTGTDVVAFEDRFGFTLPEDRGPANGHLDRPRGRSIPGGVVAPRSRTDGYAPSSRPRPRGGSPAIIERFVHSRALTCVPPGPERWKNGHHPFEVFQGLSECTVQPGGTRGGGQLAGPRRTRPHGGLREDPVGHRQDQIASIHPR